MPKYYPTRFYRAGESRPVTELMMIDQLGHHVPLLDHNGVPVNFERRPDALSRAKRAMATMDTIFNKADDND